MQRFAHRRALFVAAGALLALACTAAALPVAPRRTLARRDASGGFCCSWNGGGSCGDECGTDGSTWCHGAEANCLACGGDSWMAGTPVANCGGGAGSSSSSSSGGGGTADDGTCAMPDGVPASPAGVDNTGFATHHGKLQLVGNQLSNARGEPVQLMGMSSHGLHWFANCYTKEAIQHLVEHWGINLFRAALYVGEGGYATLRGTQNDPLDLLHNIVQWCKELGIYVMIDWHVLTPGDPNYWLAGNNAEGVDVAAFFEELAARYIGEDHVLYEIANEPNGVQWPTVKAYADALIPRIRAVDSETVIMVGTPTWSQDIDQAAANPVADPRNVMYSFHFYACTHGGLVPRVQTYASQIPIFVTEWGTSTADGASGVCLDTALEFLAAFNGAHGQLISWAQWSYADKNEASAALSPGSCAAQAWGTTSCSGTFLKNYIRANVATASGSGDPAAVTTAAQTTGDTGAATTAGTTEGPPATTAAATAARATEPAAATTRAAAETEPESACAANYGQCGGVNWSGATACCGSFVCTFGNQWYSQCVPSTAATTQAPAVSTTTATTQAPAVSTTTATTQAPAATTTQAPAATTTRARNGGDGPTCYAKWAQCGGLTFTGSSAAGCCEGAVCTVQNPWYSQCL